jgi:hypothetical protein
MDQELPARLQGQVIKYGKRDTKSILSNFDTAFAIAPPTLFTEMKSGGEILNAFGLYETATSKMGSYAGTPSPEQIKEILKLDLDAYLTVPAGNVNLSGYLAFISAWRGFVAFSAMGAGSLMGEELVIWVPPETVELIKGSPEIKEKKDREGNVSVHAKPAVQPGGYISIAEGLVTGSRMILPYIERLSPSDSIDFKGAIFPYFKEMLESDPDSTFDIFWRLFKRCVSPSSTALADAQAMYRRGFR